MEISSPRLRLEPLEERHAEALFEGLRAEAIYRFIDEEAPSSLAALRERYRRLQRRRSPSGSETWLNWAVWCLTGERYVGYVQATIRPDRSALIAYVIFPESWRRGFASEAVTMMVEELIREHGVHAFAATVDERNRASLALLRKLGFKQTGERRRNDAKARCSPADLLFHLRVPRR
jgi:ribosomal-protein-alanine N-acetyltransferase